MKATNKKAEDKDFQSIQYAFAKYLRDPAHNPAPEGIEERRLKVYRDLFFGNIRSLVSQTFPVLQKFYTTEQWDTLIREFMVQHESHTPLFLEVSSEFVRFLNKTYTRKESDPPFMLELAHYEWVELAISVMDDEPEFGNINQSGDPFTEIPYLSPFIASLAYQHPVHTLKPGTDYADRPAEPTYLLVYRKKNDSVEFMQLNVVSARLIELLSNSKTLTGEQQLKQIAAELEHPNPQSVIEGGKALLLDFRSKDIILGTRIIK